MFTTSSILGGRSLPELAESTRRAFREIEAQTQVAWFKEHTQNGGHGDIAPSSVRTPRLRLSMARGTDPAGAIYTYDARSSASNGIPLTIGPDVMWISIIAPSPGPWLLRGLVQPGVQWGDLVFIRRDPRSASNIEITDRDAANVPVGSEIHIPQDSSLSYPTFTLATPTWTPFMYGPGNGTNSVPGWGLWQLTSA